MGYTAWMLAIAKFIDAVCIALNEYIRSKYKREGAEDLAQELKEVQDAKKKKANDAVSGELGDDFLLPPSQRGK